MCQEKHLPDSTTSQVPAPKISLSAPPYTHTFTIHIKYLINTEICRIPTIIVKNMDFLKIKTVIDYYYAGSPVHYLLGFWDISLYLIKFHPFINIKLYLYLQHF